MSCVRSQATRGMSGLSARWALLAARTASSAGTVGSTMGMSSFFRRLAALGFDRVDPSRARAVAPALLAAAVRVPDRRRRALAESVALAPLPLPALVPVA